MENQIVIYFAINLINRKIYVGKSKVYKKRKNIHYYKPSLSSLFDRALQKYDREDFIWIKFEYPIEKLNDMEKYWIKELDTIHPNGYNLTEGGEGFSKNHTIQTKQILSKKSLGNVSAANRTNQKTIRFVDTSGKVYDVSNNFNDFCKEHNLPKRTVTSHLNGKRNQETLYGWRINQLDENGGIIKIKKNNNYKSWTRYCFVEVSTGKEYIIERGIDKFCKDHNLVYNVVLEHVNKPRSDRYKIYKGFDIYRLDEFNNKIVIT